MPRPPVLRRLLALVVLACALAPATAAGSAAFPLSDWSLAGRDAWNSHGNPFEFTLSPSDVPRLAEAWRAPMRGDVSATPAVVGGAVYVPDWGGYVHRLDAATGRAVWSIRLQDLPDEAAGAVSRTSPAVVGGTVYVGDQTGAHLLALDAATGALRWSTQVDAHPAAMLTAAPLVVDGVIYQGVSSSEEGSAQDPAYPCCSFRGSMVALRASDGDVLWKTYTTPAEGYSGNAVWGSTPALDAETRTLYFATGNNYSVPDAARDCAVLGGTDCTPPENWADAIVALDSTTGRTRWVFHADPGFDEWNLACRDGMSGGNCPEHPGPDFDFGAGPNLTRAGGRTLVGAGQKSGAYWMLDAATGHVVWKAFPGPGGELGGILWGTATDHQRIYVAEANAEGLPVTLPDGSTTTGSTIAALDPATGRTLWQVREPSPGSDLGGLTVADGVVYAGSTSGAMHAFDAATGAVLWTAQAAEASLAAPAVADGTVLWGNGYDKHDGAGSAQPLRAFRAPAPWWCALFAWIPGCSR